MEPNPGSNFINPFSQSWKNFAYIYCFPPFKSQKTISNNIKNWKGSHRALVIIPLGSKKSWFPMILRNIIIIPITFNSQNLQLPKANSKYSLCPEFTLVAFLLPNNIPEHEIYLSHQRIPHTYQK